MKFHLLFEFRTKKVFSKDTPYVGLDEAIKQQKVKNITLLRKIISKTQNGNVGFHPT